jgi:enoyl-CoA hydratase/carnithine racemase
MTDRITRTDSNSDSGGVCTLTIDRPDKLNALDTLAFEELDAHLAALETDGAVGCVVLRGAGRGFCAGADLGGIGSAPVPPKYKPGVIERLGTLAKPVVAAVHGVCFTGGLELALACDFILADATARFADTHGKWGLVGQWGISQRLPRRIGDAPAKLMMMTAREVGAGEAHRIGLIDILAEDLDTALAELTGQLLANSAFTNAGTKRLMIETDGMSLAEALAHEHLRHPGFAPDYQERIARFAKKP